MDEIIIMPERKSRRTHKNSRDGCPNCKVKRIKCSEELPMCANCIRKNYRCGYLDFPEEKLQEIRNKNLPAKGRSLSSGSNGPGDFTAKPSRFRKLISSSSPSTYINRTSVFSSSISPALPGPVTGKPSISSASSTQPEFFSFDPDMIFQPFPYENKPYKSFTQPSPITLAYQTPFYPQIDTPPQPQIFPLPNQTHSQGLIQRVMSPPAAVHSQMSLTPQFTDQLTQPQPLASSPQPGYTAYHTPIPMPVTTQMQAQAQIVPNSSYINSELPNYQIIDYEVPFNPIHFNGYDHGNSNLASINETPKMNREKTSLPNCQVKPTKFSKQKYSELKEPRDPLAVYYYMPVWDRESSRTFWFGFFMSSFTNPIFNSFLLDKSLGLLLANVNVVLNSEYLKNFHNTYHPVSSIKIKKEDNGELDKVSDPGETKEKKYHDFFFDKHVLNTFIKFSYIYYAKLIKCIRDGLTLSDIEDTIRISFLSSYSSYFLLNSTAGTTIKLCNGTSSLLKKFVGECKNYNQLLPRVKYITDILHNHVNFCLVPDLNFDVIDTITEQFQMFKNFLTNSTNLYQSLKDSVSIRDFLPKHDCIEFENFLNYLNNDFRTELNHINKEYNTEDDNIRIVSVKSLYELVNKYFKMLPSLANSIGPNVFVIQRVFYLFFIATGKALIHILTPIKSILNIDCTNVFYPIIDFDCGVFKVDKEKDSLNDLQFEEFNGKTKNLLRLINFYNLRSLFYGHFLSNKSVLDSKYLKLVDGSIGDVKLVEICPKKLDFSEVPLKFNKKFEFKIGLENLPRFPEFDYYPKECFENPNGICEYPGEFNYDIGLSSCDFNPSKLVEEFLNHQKTKWEFNTVRLSAMQTRSLYFDESRKTVSESLNLDD
ncbi:hypothetical protein CANTEDRAFT_137370 [Yamadazyma tenuis ATCC 10573]|uniref:Zn(2)-C6 fungal-type domain-containing protein n=1 Tax=Candida tenuis (strain ATCC 10573 / BCRC 21748 / CBS 615 / JCM 9827 / NBRC 10315 / NRRL Y-1498 / VKM Y-70) TaxID=590646 RepID=G3BD29_CANTC|nr:uncharacterized protein CANTEDRAFT_137370 [Yamadazyma tenuis ATCC 10573]EGV60905.1 hypothetical protein CANTEDRAFT_137370 [Yamadazyma tenuis ATCC 10573]